MIKVLFEAPERIDLESEDYFLDARNVSEAELSDWLDSTGNSILADLADSMFKGK